MRCSWARDARGSVLMDGGSLISDTSGFPGLMSIRDGPEEEKAARETRQIPIPKAEAALGDNNHRRGGDLSSGAQPPTPVVELEPRGRVVGPISAAGGVGLKGASPLAFTWSGETTPICEANSGKLGGQICRSATASGLGAFKAVTPTSTASTSVVLWAVGVA